jgi:hypothetical protein
VVLSTRVEDLESGVRLEVMVKSRPRRPQDSNEIGLRAAMEANQAPVTATRRAGDSRGSRVGEGRGPSALIET